jgi:hypothetical protein
LNLAPWLYRNILAIDGGPICDIATRIIDAADSLLGVKQYETLAYLNPSISPFASHRQFVYGNVDGTGASENQSISVYKAMSEALERWAFASTSSQNKLGLGFIFDPGTVGFAAYPGLSKRVARNNAHLEALERWAICAWWEGKLPGEMLSGHSFETIRIRPTSTVSVLIVSTEVERSLFAYGFAAGTNEDITRIRAVTEMDRTKRSILCIGNEVDRESLPLLERRLCWFATSEGNAEFKLRTNKSLNQKPLVGPPKKLIDTEVVGPWSKYATVWRVLYEPVSTKPRDDSEPEYFFF